MQDLLLKFPSSIFPEAKLDGVPAYFLVRDGPDEWGHSPDFAALEWGVRGGALLTVGITSIWLLLVGWRRLLPPEAQNPRIASSLQYASRSAIWLALLLLLTSLMLTAWSTSDLEYRYQRDLARLGDPAWLAKMADDQSKRLELNSPESQTP